MSVELILQGGGINWKKSVAAIWRARSQRLRPVTRLDLVSLNDLLGIDRQKKLLVENTERFLSGKPANNALLWGARGTGKSSIIKALLNVYSDQGLRVIQIDKEDLLDLPEIVDELINEPYRFVVFCDDLSFDEGDATYKALKSILEGSIELPPENVLIYATSNRRHLMPEYMHDNVQSKVVETEIHFAEAIEEKISLSDRFGLWLSFYSINQDQYLEIVDQLFGKVADQRALHAEAIRFATSKGGRSGRAARQFYNAFSGKF
ncbi:ATPase [Oleiphilus sp. HI0071]|uniref:ATP-binding protein n=1 Tax=Oleiphilus sp. HI0080 TaxID=1822255 RepID=UPI0007C2BE92|nr:ATP-binding protein [Oleiphilus sp. HI0080]KZY61076.1 ATPase [Oleiphilus sp. HI0065]KZY89710.1 ATPase [Oleiphilus sp. HI0073]KZY90262.1 ATPase [Oleiphilus sp. HI0071]KZZ46456.1 ATPase [Oleiphilus sp. HI0118]KZZ49357.1 ATPase [Oleiphilus sp. HI0122]KZZ67993.1 ATPase [Oleiphilus sp. HI0130]KZZ75307.1 ATPase [Oleiphilus sp. HI0133]